MEELELAEHVHLLALPTNQLLAKFGAGGHKPGSGSAAALSTLVACKLLQTVIALTQRNERYSAVHQQLSLANQTQLEPVEEKLTELLQLDAVQFDRVISARRARDQAAAVDRRRLNERALAELREATATPMQIAEYSLQVAETALLTFDLGFKSARGDSAVALSAALSGAVGAVSIVYLNLQSFKGSSWATTTRSQADLLLDRAQRMQVQFFARVSQLRPSDGDDAHPQVPELSFHDQQPK